MAPWAAPRKAACESAPRRPRTHAGICNDASRPRVPRSSAPPSAARTVTSSWNLAHQCRNGRLRPRRRGLRRTERAYGDRLVFTREYARGGFDHALDGASSAEPTRCISGNRPKSSPGRRFPRPAPRSGGECGVLQLRSEAGLALGSGRRGQCATAIHRKSFSSRALETAATRPVARSYPSVMRGLSPTRAASNGCTRRFSPSAPQE
jgi:hypothetical protein